MTDPITNASSEEAGRIRAAAKRLAALDGIERSGTAREVLLDLAEALADLATPIHALVEEHLDSRDEDEGYARQAREAVAALTRAAAGLHHVADNH